MNSKNTKHLLSEIWKNKRSIAEGIKNKAFKKEHIEEVAKYRASICETCIWNSSKYETYEDVPEIIKEVKDRDWIEDTVLSTGTKCIYCTCNISIDNSIKLRSLSSKCPLPEPKWEAILEDEDEVAKIYTIAAKNTD